MKSPYAWIAPLAAIGLLAAMPLLASCEGASEVQKSAKDYDNADKDAMQKQMQDAQQQQQSQQQQQEMLKQRQEDCQNTNFLEPKDNPNQTIGPNPLGDAGWDTGAMLVLADMQVAWGNGGGGSGGSGGGGGGNGSHKQPCP
jgi:hypothetical protein